MKKVRKNCHFSLDKYKDFIYTPIVNMKEIIVTIKKNSPVGKTAQRVAQRYGLDPRAFLEALLNASIDKAMEKETKAQS